MKDEYDITFWDGCPPNTKKEQSLDEQTAPLTINQVLQDEFFVN